MAIELSKNELGELIIGRNKVAASAGDNMALREAVTLFDAIIVRAITQAAPALAENSVNHLYH